MLLIGLVEMKLSVNDEVSTIASVGEFRKAMAACENLKFREIWLNLDGGPELCALLDHKSGWLMYKRSSDDAGFSSRNPNYVGNPNTTITYLLSNGQADEYPACWALEEFQVMEALAHFVQHRTQPPFIVWHAD